MDGRSVVRVMRRLLARRMMAILVAVSSVALMMSPPPAAAATRWFCQFGPLIPRVPSLNNAATLTFHAPVGLGNDSVSIDGTGACTTNPAHPCQVCGTEERATIHGTSFEAPGENRLQFGLCDPDPPAQQDDPTALLADLDVKIKVGSSNSLPFHVKIYPWIPAPFRFEDFPSPGYVSVGEIIPK